MKRFATIAFLILASAARADDAASSRPLRLYMPRTVQVQGAALLLKDVAVIRSSDESLSQKASGVTMGRSPLSREQLVIDRNTILSRLASVGITQESVEITGSDKVTVTRVENIVSPKEIVEAAQKLLDSRKPGGAGASYRLTSVPKEMAVPGQEPAHLTAHLAAENANDRAKVIVMASVGEKTVASQEVAFQLTYVLRRAITVEAIPAGGLITPQNTRIETVSLEHASTEGPWVEPFGLTSPTSLPKGAVLKPGMLKTPSQAVLVKRNQGVVMRVSGAGFRLAAMGKALDDGRPGDIIKVLNVDTNRVVSARVSNDGTVEPMLDEAKK